MPVYDQGYRNWNGPLRGHALRWLTITAASVRLNLKNKWVLLTCGAAMFPMLGLAFGAVLRLRMVDNVVRTTGDETVGDALAKNFGGDFYLQLVAFQIFWVAVMCALVGAGLIARDREARALELYLSRPVKKFDYILGKFGVIFAFNMLVTAVPFLVLYLVVALASPSLDYLRATWKVPFGLAASGVVISAVSSCVILGLSSLLARPRIVSVVWIGMHFLTLTLGNLLWDLVKNAQLNMISFSSNLHRVAIALLDTSVPRNMDFSPVYAGLVITALSVVAMGIVIWRVRAVEAVSG